MKIIPYFRKSTSAVYVRLRDGKSVDFRISTGLYIDPIHYDASVPGYSKKSDVPQEVRDKFNKQLADILLLIGKEYYSGCTPDYIRNVINGYFEPNSQAKEHEDLDDTKTGFFDRAEQYLREVKNGKECKGAVTAIFRRLHRYEAWQREKEGRKGFSLQVENFGADELERFMKYITEEYTYFVNNPDFFSHFEIYHNTMKPSSANSAFSGGTRLKAFLNWCVKKGYTTDTSFRSVKVDKHVYGIPYYLTIEERDQVLHREISFSPRIELARDIFVFQCLVGCRVGDLFALTRANIIDDFLEYIPSKNISKGKTETVRVPLCGKALDILAKYEKYSPRLFPVLDEHFYNVAIQFVLELCGVNRMVPVLNPLTRQEEMKPLYEVATTHTARKTFIGNIYKYVKDQALVASLTGHAPNSRAFARYRTIDDDMKREIINLIK